MRASLIYLALLLFSIQGMAESQTNWKNYIDNCYKFARANDDSGFYYCAYILDNLKVENDTTTYLKAIAYHAILSSRKSKLDEAKMLFEQGLKISRKFGLKETEISYLVNLANLYSKTNLYRVANDLFEEALTIAIEVNDSIRLGGIYLGIATNYSKLGNLDQAIEYNIMAIEAKKKIYPPMQLIKSYSNLALLYRRANNFELAFPLFERVLDLAMRKEDKLEMAVAYNNMGWVRKKQNKMDQAIQYYTRSVELYTELKNPIRKANSLANLSIAYAIIGEKRKSIDAFDELERILRDSQNEKLITDHYDEKSEMFSYLGDYKNAYSYLQKFKKHKVDRLNEQLYADMAEMEVILDNHKKEKENLKLDAEKNLALADKYKLQNYLFIGGFLFIILGVVLPILLYFRNKRLNSEKIADKLRIDNLHNKVYDLSLDNKKNRENLPDINEINANLDMPLSNREKDVLEELLKGKTNTEISKHLFISNSTVKFHLRNIYEKLEVSNRKQAFGKLQEIQN